jgi:hypothetical protein
MLAGDLAHVGGAEAGQLDDLGRWYACPQRGDHDLYERLLRSLMRRVGALVPGVGAAELGA